ncbi:MAG TPA: sugar phosphate nucleotidyltransferase [bacterium]|nr:sugar phosphate nucleotidyltransferase [bacterium]
MKGIILAAGKGTRLRPWTDNKPKPLLEMAGKPILNYVLDGFVEAGVDDISLVIGYLGDMIKEYYGDNYKGSALRYFEQKELLGTGHALMLAEDVLKNNIFMLSFGDVLVDIENYSNLVEFHERGGFDASITLNEVDDPYAGAAVYVEDQRVVKLIEKPPRGESTTNWNNRGIFIFTPVIFDEVHNLKKSPRGEYDLPTAVNELVEKGRLVGGMPIKGFTSDVGTQEDFKEYENYVLNKK